ncbi:MAG: polysaccharide deacetylase family protein [Firmicutes bacterium]|nr:polysaccharide deacetylase family protein [Bacillota bacterium]
MTRKKRNRGKTRAVTLAVIVILLAVITTGYAASRGALGPGAYSFMRTVFHPAEPASPPEGPPGEPPDSGNGEPGPEDQDPVGLPNREEPSTGDPTAPGTPPASTPVIYVGQSLIIPVPGGTVESGSSQVISKGTSTAGSKEIALTFDSGWLFDQTIPLLDLLDRHGVTATFFPRALWAEEHPDLIGEIVGRGHAVGNHSLTHPHMKELDKKGIYREIQKSTEIIQRTAGVRPYLFRPPYGEYNQEILKILEQEGYPYTIMWTIDTHDWADKIGGEIVSVDYVVNRVLDNATPGAIILMHVGGPKTVQALPQIITGLRDKGYTFNTVEKMLPSSHANRTVHQVKKGETLYSISKRYGVTVQQLIDINDL